MILLSAQFTHKSTFYYHDIERCAKHGDAIGDQACILPLLIAYTS